MLDPCKSINPLVKTHIIKSIISLLLFSALCLSLLSDMTVALGLNIFYSGIKYTEKDWVRLKVRYNPLQNCRLCYLHWAGCLLSLCIFPLLILHWFIFFNLRLHFVWFLLSPKGSVPSHTHHFIISLFNRHLIQYFCTIPAFLKISPKSNPVHLVSPSVPSHTHHFIISLSHRHLIQCSMRPYIPKNLFFFFL